MEILIGLAVFFLAWGIIVWRIRIVQARHARWIDSAYTRANCSKFSGYWIWPKNKDNI